MRCLFGPRHGQDVPIGRDEGYVAVTCMNEIEVPVDYRKWRNDSIAPTASVNLFHYRRMKIHWRKVKDRADRDLITEVLVPSEWDDDRVMEQIFYTFLS